jgi:flagellar basal body-associated protein FliL
MRDNLRVQEAFGIVLFVVVFVGAILACIAFFGSSKLYGQIGRGGLSLNEDREDGRPRTQPAAVPAGERDAEIRQFLVARNERRERQGKPPLDIEAELKRLTAPVVDAGLRDEVRQLVEARNERRARQGKPPLDVEAEIERQLRDLAG